MTATALTGCIIIGAVVIFINVLFFWSRKSCPKPLVLVKPRAGVRFFIDRFT